MNKQETVQQALYDFESDIIHRFPVVISLMAHDNNIILGSIVIEKSQRGQGFGTQILTELCRFADLHGVSITLTPDGSLGGNLRRLKSFYRRFGFKKNKDYFFSESMMRASDNASFL